MLRFLHAADLHLGSPFRLPHEGPLPAPFSDATYRAFRRVVSLAVLEKVDAVLLAGDLYNQAERSIAARLQLSQGLWRLHEAGIRSFVVHGNHDPLSADPGGLTLPDSVTVFGGSVSEVEVPDGRGGVRYRVQGVSYLQAETRDDLSARFSRRGPEVTIGVLHANLGAHPGHHPYAPCTREGLSSVGLDYWALGHVHEAAIIDLQHGALAVYPGNPQGRHLKEMGPRYAALVEIDEGPGRRPRARLVSVEAVRWHALHVDIEGLSGVDELLQAFAQALGLAELQAVEGAVLQLTVRGRGPLHQHLVSAVAQAELFAGLRDRLSSASVLVASLDIETEPVFSLDALLAEGGLLGELARVAQANDAAAAAEVFASDPELQALERALSSAGLPALSRQAAHADGLSLALSLLAGETR